MHWQSDTFVRFLCAASLLAAALPLSAHDFRSDATAEGYIIYYGHDSTSEHQHDDVRLRLDPKKLLPLLCYQGMQTRSIQPIPADNHIAIHARCDILTANYRSGHFTKTTTGTVEAPKNKTRYALKSWISYEYLKRIDRFDRASTPTGQALEITPLPGTSSGPPASGDWITLIVTGNGSPLQGLPVAINGEVRGVTDESGKIRLRIRNAKMQIFQVTRSIPLRREDADEEIHTATLQFETNR